MSEKHHDSSRKGTLLQSMWEAGIGEACLLEGNPYWTMSDMMEASFVTGVPARGCLGLAAGWMV